jgi:gluconolactonase
MPLTIDDISVFAEGLDHPECVAVHPDGSVWAGGEAGQIYRISRDGKQVELVNSTGGFILGIAFSPAADWLAACDLANKCVWKLETGSNKLTHFALGADGETFKIPNFPAFTKEGRLFVSDSGAFRQVNGRIYCFEPSGKGEIWEKGPYNFANGMALSAGEDFLYVVCSWLPGVERIRINRDGTAGEREVYCRLPQTCPDGLAFDAGGNLYVSCYAPNRIYKVDPQRQITLLVDDWEAHTLSNPTNIAFGGDNFDQLFTANLGRWHLSRINLGARGLKLPCH